MVLRGAFTGTGVGLGALAADRQALAVAHAAIAADLDQALDIEGNVPAEVALHVAVLVDIISQFGCIILGQVPDADVGV